MSVLSAAIGDRYQPATRTIAGPFEVPTVESLNGMLADFEVLDVLGRGGMGAVYKARQTKLDRTVAIKVLPQQLAKDAGLIQRFVRESKALARLHHPHVVTAFDVGEVQGMPYLVMEYVDGTDLASYVRDMGSVDPALAVRWIIQAAEGLEFAHRKGIVHRDIKPGNLLVDQDGTVKILDLGLARFEQDAAGGMQNAPLTQSGNVMGTVAFMSPEQAADTRSADARSDIYSLGCTLYYLLTGRGLFQEDTPVKTILAHRDRPVPTLCGERSQMPPELNAVFQKMVAKSPDRRQRSMADVCGELRGCLERMGASSSAAVTDRRPPSSLPYGDSALAQTARIAPADLQSANAVTPSPSPVRQASKTLRWLTIAALGLVALLGVVAYRIQTDHGTLVLKIDEAAKSQIETQLQGGGLVLVDKAKGTSWVVKPQQLETKPSGTYQLKPVDGLLLTVSNDAGLELKTEEFTLKRGDKVVVRVSLLPAQIDAASATVASKSPATAPTGEASPKTFFVPPGLQPGDVYHLVFVTSWSRDAKSAEIADYNQFVNNVANAAGLGPKQFDRSPVGPIRWFAIGSTAQVAARDNARVEGPIYNTLGKRIAAGADDLWQGRLQHPISVTEHGTRLPSFYDKSVNLPDFLTVYTGSLSDGTPHPTQALGAVPASGTAAFQYGHVDATDGKWLNTAQHRGFFHRPMYALSQKLTVPVLTP